MTFGPGGSFDLTLSPGDRTPGHAGDRIRLEPEAHTVIARQYHLHRSAETAARYMIEAVGHGPGAVPVVAGRPGAPDDMYRARGEGDQVVQVDPVRTPSSSASGAPRPARRTTTSTPSGW